MAIVAVVAAQVLEEMAEEVEVEEAVLVCRRASIGEATTHMPGPAVAVAGGTAPGRHAEVRRLRWWCVALAVVWW